MHTHRVKEIFRVHQSASVSIPDDSPLEDVVAKFVREPTDRGIFLVDSQKRFVGVISRLDLMRWMHIQFFSGKGRREIPVFEFIRIADAKKAKDIMRSDRTAPYIKETNSIQEALEKMLNYEEDVIPVLNTEGKILGDLTLSEILWWALRFAKKKDE
jgi:CBS domain-containing protein